MNASDKLRAEATEMRQQVDAVLKQDSGNQLRLELSSIVSLNDIGAMRQQLEAAISKIPTTSQLQRQAIVVTGTVTANVYDALADFYDTLAERPSMDAAVARRTEFAKRNDLIRKAAAMGDYDAVRRYASGQYDEPVGAGSS